MPTTVDLILMQGLINNKNRLDWLRKNKKFKFYFDNEFFANNTDFIKKYLDSLEKQPTSSQMRTIGLICDLSLLYSVNIEEKYNEYKSEKSTTRKLEIRYGKERAIEFEKKLRSKKQPQLNSWWTVKYWVNKGLTEQEAKEKVSEIQKDNSRKSWSKERDYKASSPLSVRYWQNLGYTDMNVIEMLRKPYLDKCSNTLSRYIEKYGEEEGKRVFQEANDKRHQTMMEKYGSRVVSAGVSKESLRFLIKLYRVLRKNGIQKTDVVWGIAGKKEFVLTDFEKKKSYFYDFVIKSKKIIVEYNNLFWHPREDVEWKGLRDYHESMEWQETKKRLAQSRGYEIYYVWNDDDLNEMVNYLSGVILND